MKTENLSTLKIHKMSQAQYDREKAAGRIDENAIYLTPDEGADLSGYATVEQLNAKADANHNHNDIYYTETEIDTKLASKSDATHNHDDRYYTETEINNKLDNKADISHTHTKADVGLGNVENKSSATIRGELTKANVTTALGYTPPTQDTTYTAITNDEIDEICSGTMATYLESISSEGVSF